MWNPRRTFKNVNDMWKESVANESPLLSNYPADFWEYYRSNYVRLDALFRQMFLSFTYFLQDDDETLSTITDNFTNAVYNHLLLNHKKYEELFRVEVLEDTDYNFNRNYDISETFSGTTSDTHSDTIGSRNDSSSTSYGARSDSTSTSIGERSDSGSVVSGARTDSKSTTLGQRSDSTTNTFGSRTDNTTVDNGAHEDELEHDVSPDDSEDFYNHRKDINSYGAKEDTTEFVKGSEEDTIAFTKGSETDTESITKGSETDTSSYTQGAQSNSETFSKGAETDTVSATKGQQLNSGTASSTAAHTLTKAGIVGNITPAKLLEQHVGYWKIHEFYKYIFYQISKELLMV